MNEMYNFDQGLKCEKLGRLFPKQQQPGQPGMEYLMNPKPIFDDQEYRPSGKLNGKVAIVTGGDSGIGRAVSVAYAREGAGVVISYLNEHEDANYTQNYIRGFGGRCILVPGDLTSKVNCENLVRAALQTYGRLDILVNNAGVQYYQEKLEDISDEQFDHTMKSNVYTMFYLTKAALPYMSAGSSIINTTSITTFLGEPGLIDYVTSKGAQVGFTRALAKNLAGKNIRVNEVAPGYFWTPLQPATGWPDERIVAFGADAPMKRAGEPAEIAPTYVYLASSDSRYVTGQTLHVNGGVFFG